MPQSLGRYQILAELGSGGMARVFLARAFGAGGFERLVAIKCCHPHLRADPGFATMLLDEARLAAQIRHHNVVAMLDVADDGGELYLVMEYIEGDKLSALVSAALQAKRRVPLEITLRILCDALAGLHAAHELRDHAGHSVNLIHRDVSPQNVLVGVDGVARIADFGIAKAEARVTVTRDGQLKGKLSYMAPEQITEGTATRQSDVFSAGIVLWEVLVGRRLFKADSEGVALNKLLHGEVPPPSSLVGDVPPEIDRIVLRALERDPALRFATAADFGDALEHGPVRPATARVVGAFLDEMLADKFARQREVVRRSVAVVVPDGVDDERRDPGRLVPQVARDAGASLSARIRRRLRQPGLRWGATILVVVAAVMAGVWIAQDLRAERLGPTPVLVPSVQVPRSTAPVADPARPGVPIPTQVLDPPAAPPDAGVLRPRAGRGTAPRRPLRPPPGREYTSPVL